MVVVGGQRPAGQRLCWCWRITKPATGEGDECEMRESERSSLSLNFYGLFADLFTLYIVRKWDKNSGLNSSKSHPLSQVNFVVKRLILMVVLV